MSKYKVGDRVKVRPGADVFGMVNYNNGVGVGNFGVVIDDDCTLNLGYPIQVKGDNGNTEIFKKSQLELVEKKMAKSFDNLKAGDVFYDQTGGARKIELVEFVQYQDTQGTTWTSDYMKKNLTLTAPKVKELTLAQIAKKFNIPIKQLRIKDKQ